jgi:hypothetical protein
MRNTTKQRTIALSTVLTMVDTSRQQFDAIQVVHFSCSVCQRQQFDAIKVVHFSCSICQRQQFDAIQEVHFSCSVCQRQQCCL